MDKNQSETSNGLKTVLRIVVIGLILILLVFLSIGIVRIVPKTLNSLANASLSIGNLFSNSTSTTSTSNISSDSNSSPTTSVTIATSTNGGFSIRELTTNSTTTSHTISGNTSGVGTSQNAGQNTDATTDTHTSNTTNTSSHTNTSTTGQSASTQVSTARTVGPSDIAVEITSKGIIDRTTGQYIPTNTFSTSDMVVVKFKIENRGQYATGVWAARVDMPSQNTSDQVRTLGPVNSLPAGSAITGEARFDRPTAGTPSVVITVDTSNATQDSNRSNNTISVPISVSGYNSGTNTNPGSGSSLSDLQVRIISTGIVNDYGQYSANISPRFGQKAAVQFEVTNIGGVSTGSWTWRADISGASNNTYNSPAEFSLAPGASTRLIVGFPIGTYSQYPYYGNSTLSYTLLVDSANAIYELSEANNTAYTSQTISY